MAVTIKDLARAAGVSHTTVSRALHDHPAISTETIARIKNLAVSMGYVPNATARDFKTRRTRALGCHRQRHRRPILERGHARRG